jgi:hypothetical protein
MENVGILCDHLESFTTILYILFSVWYCLWRFYVLVSLNQEKSGNPCLRLITLSAKTGRLFILQPSPFSSILRHQSGKAGEIVRTHSV